MYMVMVEAGFSAVHALRLEDGTCEPQHGHDWRVRACFATAELDATGMVVDFHTAQSALQSVAASLHGTDLNRHEALGGRNPTAEVVAGYIFQRLALHALRTLRRVEVTEAPGYVAIYEPHPGSGNTE
jgi:6-pyruvoyltetrahydropterin/6-carboxytetrahydropterin synthase